MHTEHVFKVTAHANGDSFDHAWQSLGSASSASTAPNSHTISCGRDRSLCADML